MPNGFITYRNHYLWQKEPWLRQRDTQIQTHGPTHIHWWSEENGRFLSYCIEVGGLYIVEPIYCPYTVFRTLPTVLRHVLLREFLFFQGKSTQMINHSLAHSMKKCIMLWGLLRKNAKYSWGVNVSSCCANQHVIPFLSSSSSWYWEIILYIEV